MPITQADKAGEHAEADRHQHRAVGLAAPTPNEKRLVRKCQPNTASKIPPKITQVVGCVNAAAIPIRNSAVRAPHDVRAVVRGTGS